MSGRPDVVVIGAGVNGLCAATFLARAGKQVLLLEAEDTVGGSAQALETDRGFLLPQAVASLHAIDPIMLKKLRAVRRNLHFAARDLPTVALSQHGLPLVLSRDVHATARSIAIQSQHDAAAWPAWHAALYGLARAMRRAWWRNERPKLGRQDEALLLALRASSAAAWLDNHFESERLKAALAFDALGANVSLLEPGSGLALLWRAAQEMCGLQGATAIPRRGTAQLVHLLAEAATNAGVALRSGARVERILVDADGVAGVALAGGETLDCRQVISTLSEETTLLGLAADAVPFGRASHLAAERARTGTASFAFALGENPNFQVLDGLGNARIVIADSLETHVTAQAAARNGMLPDELPVEALLISASDDSVAPPEKHVLCATVRPVPAADAAWTTLAPRLEARTLSTLDRFAPGLVPKIVESHASTPRERGGCVAASPSHVLASWHDRIVTPVPGLYLAGADAEPVAALSGRAGRIAAEIVSAA